jgi:toxin YoeB
VKLVFSSKAWGEYLHWQATDEAVLPRLNSLIAECMRSPFTGLGKPEPLKAELKGWWSRRLTIEDRLVYRVVGKPGEQELHILQCRYHY